MRGMQKAVVMAVVLIAGILATGSVRAGAVAKEDLEIAIKKAELAVLVVKSPEYEAQRMYLKDKVTLAKKVVLDFERYQDANLSELVATLEEGARALRLTSGVDREDEETKSTEVALNETQSTAIVQQHKVEPMKNEAVQTQNGRQAVITDVKTSEVKGQEVKPAELTVAKVEGEREDETVEVPKTGEAEEEEKSEPSPVAVAITVGVVVGLSAAGAVAIVRRMKRGL